MVDVRKTAYHITAVSALGADLNADASDAWTALSAEVDNSTTGYLFMDIEITLASADFTTPGGTDMAYEIYVVPSVDGTGYPNTINTGAATAQENQQYFVGAVTVHDVNGAFVGTIRGVDMPPGKWKLFGRNRTNRALAATGNEIKYRPYSYQSA